jgi:hypothetical protein
LSQAKPFQDATVRAALAAFAARGGRRRFLVADEVGLGKTVVARDVIAAMAAGRPRQLVVYYVASGAAVASQNKRRLVGFLPEGARTKATHTPDRLSLIGSSVLPETPVVVYALTPETSFPGVKARLTGGRANERGFLGQLLYRSYPALLAKLPAGFLQLEARSGWSWAQEQAKARLAAAPPGFIARFREALHLEFAEVAAAGPARQFSRRLSELALPAPRRFIGRLRRALCLACLIDRPPDLVILDEFQRYRHLITSEGAEDPLMRQLLKGSGAPPALLLLSATPYKLFASRWEEARGGLAHREFFDLLDFLAGEAARTEAEALFRSFGDSLRLLAALSPEAREQTEAVVGEARALRDRLQALVAPVVARTERDAFATASEVLEPAVTPLTSELRQEDVVAYRHLLRGVEPRRRADALAYWSSVPLAAQALGQRYVLSRDRVFKPMRGLTSLTKDRRDRFARTTWPDAKLRALAAAVAPEQLALPWIAPSAPWWPLDGAWARQNADAKLLMFSRFRVTPPAVASLLSFGAEARWIDPRGGYDKAYARRRLKLSDVPNPVMAAFHPAPWLIRHVDPLHAPDRSRGALRRHLRAQMTAGLKALGIRVDRTTAERRRRRRPIGRLIPALEQAAGLAQASADAWAEVTGHDRQAVAAIAAWRGAPPLVTVSPRELEDLVTYALCAPGVLLGRALLRHAPDALDPTPFRALVRTSWQGLRAYLDNPVLLSAMGGESAVEAILQATLDGGFESMLDEHLWMRAKLHEGSIALLDDLRETLTLITGAFSYQALGREGRIRLRCHAAMPFGDAETNTAPTPRVAPAASLEDDSRPVRPDEVRRSFNSPFWPHVLATTSVGQEGLDFHPWCSRVLHWDLPSNPLDLEQREGRIQRFAGLSIRRRLGALLGAGSLDAKPGEPASPWSRLEAAAEARYADAAGLQPWWILPGAQVQRHVFERPFGRDAIRFRTLRAQRFLYRLALGQPNQEDLLEMLARSDPEMIARLRSLSLDLCPFPRTTTEYTR